MTLEDRLRQAMRRVEPGEDFADRVLARLGDDPARGAGTAPETAPAASRPRARAPWALAASLVLAIGVAALAGRTAWNAHTARLDAERLEARNVAAGRELAFALDLTSRRLESVHRHLTSKPAETGS